MLSADGVHRVVASGNGAAYHVAVAVWLASLEMPSGPEVLAAPSGLLARGEFAWRPGDVLLAVSSSGEFRDLVEAVDAGVPTPYAALTANAGSTLGSRAEARALVSVPNQRAVTHTQAFCGAVVAALGVWAEVTSDAGLAAVLRRLPDELEITIARARAVGRRDRRGRCRGGGRFRKRSGVGSGARGRAAAQGGRRHSGRRRRDAGGRDLGDDGAESGALALSLPTGAADPLLAEAEEICADRGATVLRAPAGETGDRRLAAVSTFPAAAALSAQLGIDRGLDIDQPAWTDAYYRVARRTA